MCQLSYARIISYIACGGTRFKLIIVTIIGTVTMVIIVIVISFCCCIIWGEGEDFEEFRSYSDRLISSGINGCNGDLTCFFTKKVCK